MTFGEKKTYPFDQTNYLMYMPDTCLAQPYGPEPKQPPPPFYPNNSLSPFHSPTFAYPNQIQQQNPKGLATQLETTGKMGGCGMTGTPSENLFPRRFLNLNRPTPNERWMAQASGPEADVSNVFVRNPMYKSALTNPKFGDYNDNIFRTPIETAEPLESMGVMKNHFTGEVFEGFKKQMPTPDQNQAIFPSQMQQTNPKLIWLNAGQDSNHPWQSKQELAYSMQRADAGRNVWGTQLYAGQVRERENQYIGQQIWGNQGGNYCVQNSGYAKETPFGFVGYQNMVRFLPWLPPTQVLDCDNYTGHVDGPDAGINPDTVPIVFSNRVDFDSCVYRPSNNEGAVNGVDGPSGFTFAPIEKQSMRIEDPFPHWIDGEDHNYSGFAETWIRDSLKEAEMSEAFPSHSATGVENDYVVSFEIRPPNDKELMNSPFAAHSATGVESDYVVYEQIRDSGEKELMNEAFPSYAVNGTEQNYVVACPFIERDTQKMFFEGQEQPILQAEYAVGDNIGWMGDLKDTRRQEYSSDSHNIGGAGQPDIEATYVSPGINDPNPSCRNTQEYLYTVVSRVPEGTDTSQNARWYPDFSQRLLKREFTQQREVIENGDQIVAPRCVPLLQSMSCKVGDVCQTFQERIGNNGVYQEQ